jgi:hypothetical protein
MILDSITKKYNMSLLKLKNVNSKPTDKDNLSRQLIHVINFLDPVILPLGMTSGNACPAGRGLEVIDRYIDAPEHEAFAHVIELVRGVDIMTGAAGPPLFAVNVQIVEVDVPIPKTSYCVRLFFCNHRFLVAVKAEVILALLVLCIKLMRKREPENERVVRAVRIMAGAAIALYHRTVLKTPLFPKLFILVALETKIVDLILQQILVPRKMG